MHFSRSTCAFFLLALPLSFATVAAVGQQLQQLPDVVPQVGPQPSASLPAPAPPSAPASAPVSATARTPAPFPPGQFRQAAPGTLDRLRGGSVEVATPVINNIASDTQLRGTTDNNTASNIVTGNNMIQSSFANTAGLPVVIQNSGANVLIQNATVVNLQFK